MTDQLSRICRDQKSSLFCKATTSARCSSLCSCKWPRSVRVLAVRSTRDSFWQCWMPSTMNSPEKTSRKIQGFKLDEVGDGRRGGEALRAEVKVGMPARLLSLSTSEVIKTAQGIRQAVQLSLTNLQIENVDIQPPILHPLLHPLALQYQPVPLILASQGHLSQH